MTRIAFQGTRDAGAEDNTFLVLRRPITLNPLVRHHFRRWIDALRGSPSIYAGTQSAYCDSPPFWIQGAGSALGLSVAVLQMGPNRARRGDVGDPLGERVTHREGLTALPLAAST